MKLRLFVIFIGLVGLSACENRYGFDFGSDWDWHSLKKQSSNENVIAQINNLEKNLSLKEARFLFIQLSSLKNPSDITHLSKIESDQNKSGGGYYGYIPDYFKNPDKIPIPENFESIIACANYLANTRTQIDRIITRSNFQYNKTFLKQEISAVNKAETHPDIQIDINTDAVMDVITHYINQNITMETATDIANCPSFQQMLKNRKEIGYIPEPLPDTDDLAKFIYTAGSNDPVSMIWKWINPWNCFGFADLYMNSTKYCEIVSEINSNKEYLISSIKSRIGRYLPEDFKYQDQIDLGVNWGVLNWSTEKQIGINIVHLKNDYSAFKRIVSRQLFRKIQIHIIKEMKNISPDDDIQINKIIAVNYKNIYDQLFSEVLFQIFLEGTSAYAAGKEKSWIITDGYKFGRDLLNSIHFSLYNTVNLKTVKYCESQGFSPNGPLVAIGYQMTKVLVKQYGHQIIYETLANNFLDFFIKYIEIEKEYGKGKIKIFDPDIVEKIYYLNSL
jgi:pterin-4a-carbinolamine dehydratase